MRVCAFSFACPDRAVTLLPHVGVLLGAPFVVRFWVESFKGVVDQPIRSNNGVDEFVHLFDVQAPLPQSVANVGFVVFADDAQHLIVARLQIIVEAKQGICALDGVLRLIRLQQHKTKTGNIVHFVGAGNIAVQRCFASTQPLEGLVVHDAKYLGMRLCVDQGFNVSGRQARFKVMSCGMG